MPRLKITFLLPLPGTDPIGGFKVVYEYANFLSRRGHSVAVVHPAIYEIDRPIRSLPLRSAARTVWSYLAHRITGSFRPRRWFAVDPAVRLLWVPSLAARFIPDGDVLIATAWQTAEWLAQDLASKGRKFYLLQHLETWSGPEDRVLATWRLPCEKIVINRWLQQIAEDLGQTAHLVPIGLDFTSFTLTRPSADRDPNNLLMLFQTLAWKGSEEGLAAFALAREQEPALRLTLFGVARRPDSLPNGVVYHHNPPQQLLRDLYNQASIFISPSWAEGFPLPPAEAMQCGAALVSTDIPGTAMYAIHEQTALLSPVGDPQAMAENILRLRRDRELRLRLAQAGHALIQQFTWAKAGQALENILLTAQPCDRPPGKL
jgi:glycosyltransferase involved in cell wall biosynthesis